jgi:hypothetical protein
MSCGFLLILKPSFFSSYVYLLSCILILCFPKKIIIPISKPLALVRRGSLVQSLCTGLEQLLLCVALGTKLEAAQVPASADVLLSLSLELAKLNKDVANASGHIPGYEQRQAESVSPLSLVRKIDMELTAAASN